MDNEIEILPPPPVRNRTHHLQGLGLLAANSLRHRLFGNQTPRPQPLSDPESAYHYADSVVSNWLNHVQRYLRHPPELDGKSALELEPGPDLGTGLVLLGKGLGSYHAIDAHYSLARHPEQLHRGIAERFAAETGQSAEPLLEALEKWAEGSAGSLQYVHDPRFRLEDFGENTMDFLLSHAVFEHLSDVARVVKGLSFVARPGALLIAEIDLQTHTRWIRQIDPLNIYRYSPFIYRSFGFSGIPNRVRPDDYKDLLLSKGWCDVHFFPRRVLPPEYIEKVEPSLAPAFRGDREHLGWLSIVLCARYTGETE